MTGSSDSYGSLPWCRINGDATGAFHVSSPKLQAGHQLRGYENKIITTKVPDRATVSLYIAPRGSIRRSCLRGASPQKATRQLGRHLTSSRTCRRTLQAYPGRHGAASNWGSSNRSSPSGEWIQNVITLITIAAPTSSVTATGAQATASAHPGSLYQRVSRRAGPPETSFSVVLLIS